MKYLLAAVIGLLASGAAAAPPAKVGACAQTTITTIGTRFGSPLARPKSAGDDQGTMVELANGVVGVSYSYVPAVAASQVGDRVRTCLVSVPRGCPKGDNRGKEYQTTNLRTRGSWALPDSQHMCGGA